MSRQIEFGVEVIDTITGLQGIVIGRVSYITGCDQYLVQPRVDKEGKYIDSRWVDEHRLDFVLKGKKVVLTTEAQREHGPCEPAPTK